MVPLLFVLLLLALLQVGCSADLDALFADQQALIALLPARPDDEVAAECGMCAAKKCEQARVACENDDGCALLLSCKWQCWQPACLFACEAEHAARGKHNNFHTCLYDNKCPGDPACHSECEAEHRAADIYFAYHTCVFDKECREACATGENWQCLDNFSWSPPDGEHASVPQLTVLVKDVNKLDETIPGAVGVEVYARASPADRERNPGMATIIPTKPRVYSQIG